MNQHNERFETVLPDQLRRRYRSPAPPPSYIRPVKPKQKQKRPAVWLAFSVVLICSAVIGAALLSRHEMPAPTPTPVPLPTPTPLPVPVVEVRKAGYILHRETLMPYGEKLMTRYLGSVPSQESLPLIGNHIGDAYSVGTYEFVWVAPGVWIDPVMEQ
jgi:hypothetical protein